VSIESVKHRITKLEEREGLDSNPFFVISRSRESSNPWGLQVSTTKEYRPLSVEESLELFWLHYTGKRELYLGFKATAETFADFLRAFEDFGIIDTPEGQEQAEERARILEKIEKLGYKQPVRPLLPEYFTELIISENKNPKEFLKG